VVELQGSKLLGTKTIAACFLFLWSVQIKVDGIF